MSPISRRMPTPQAMIFTVLGMYCLDDNPKIPTSVYLRVLEKLDIGEHTTRTTLTRMRERGYLKRVRRGREVLWYASETGLAIVRRQRRLTFEERSVLPDPDGVWTVVSFSFPEVRRRDRDILRQRLAWEGFGTLRDGVWISPGERDMSDILSGKEFSIKGYVDVFVGHPRYADMSNMIARAWQLPTLIERYRAFLSEWEEPSRAPSAADALGINILLITDWRQLARETPLLSRKYLPENWPAHQAMQVFQRLQQRYASEAGLIFYKLLAESRDDRKV